MNQDEKQALVQTAVESYNAGLKAGNRFERTRILELLERLYPDTNWELILGEADK